MQCNKLKLGFVVLIALGLVAGCGKGKKQFVTIGTGGITGVYYPTGGAIAKMVNKKSSEYGLRVTVESTGGSVFNINAVMQGDLDFGIAQSDRQYQAYHGTAEWQEKGAQKELRAVFAIHHEAVTLIAAADAGIIGIQDLKGKRVNIGNPGSGHRQNAIDALTYAGMDYQKDLKAEGIKAAEAPKLLQDGRIDAFFYTVGHPSGAIKEVAAGKRKVRLVSILGMEKLFKDLPYYTQAIIPIKHYPGLRNKEDGQTIGVRATLITSSAVPANVVYAITKEVFSNFAEFKTLHPAYASLTKADMLKGLTAPLHPGAEKFYREAGLL